MAVAPGFDAKVTALGAVVGSVWRSCTRLGTYSHADIAMGLPMRLSNKARLIGLTAGLVKSERGLGVA